MLVFSMVEFHITVLFQDPKILPSPARVIAPLFPLHCTFCRHGWVYKRLRHWGQQRDRPLQPSAAGAAGPVRPVIDSVCSSTAPISFVEGESQWGGERGGHRGCVPNTPLKWLVCVHTTCICRNCCCPCIIYLLRHILSWFNVTNITCAVS